MWKCRGALPLVEIWSRKFVNKLVEWETIINCMWRECTQMKNEFLFQILRLSVFPWCKDSPQIVMLWWEWLRRSKWRETGLDPSVLFSSTSGRCYSGFRVATGKHRVRKLTERLHCKLHRTKTPTEFYSPLPTIHKTLQGKLSFSKTSKSFAMIPKLNTFSLLLIISFKRDKNLGNPLVRSAFKFDNQPGTFTSKRTRC